MKLRLATLAVLALIVCRPLDGAPMFSLVEGLDKFEGSGSAWQLLQTNGFVVADPTFKHIYDPYVDASLPVFITVDSAWDTYHRLLDYSLGQMDAAQARRLAAFSRRLVTAAREQAQIDGQDFMALSSYAAMGLALRDDEFAASLSEAQRKVIDQLRGGVGLVETGLGFPLDARAFKSPGAAPLPPGKADDFAARQWYATVIFRASDTRETRLAFSLAWLIHRDAALDAAWREIARADDAIYGPSPLGSVPTYLAALGTLQPSDVANHIDALRAALPKNAPKPDENDQVLAPGESSQGFRLLPPRQVPSWTAKREAMPLVTPGSVLGDSLQLLTHWRTNAASSTVWSDLRTWRALGQWAELQSPAGPIGKTNDLLPAVPGGPEGVVEASPAFFSGLAEISRRAAKAFRQAGADADCEKRWTDFAAVCQRLAELAAKQAGAIELTATDRAWIRNYGRTLAKFHFDNDDTSDFPIISRVGSDPTAKSATYAWVAPPQALYVILPYRGRLRLFCGAVLSYRESVRDVGSVVPTNEPPAPPEFTETFRAEKTVGDLLADLLDETSGHDSPGDQQATVQQLEARLTDADVPALIQALSANLEQPANGPSPVAELIAKMNWGPFQVALLRLVETNEAAAQPVASILAQQPGDIDVGWICANFDRQSPMARAMFCFLLGQHGSAPPSAAVLDRAAGDADENVRWSAVMALRALQLTNDQGVAALSGCLGDANEFVAAAAARTLAMWGATNAAPALLANLQTRLASARAFTNGWRNQSDLFRRLSWISGDAGAMEERSALLDGQRFPDFAGSLLASPAVNAMAQAMGELRYMPAVEPLFAMLDGDCGLAAARALDQLAPDLLRGKLMDTACDPRRDPEDRDRALQLLLQTAPSKSEARRLEPLLDEGAEVSVKSPRGPAMGRMGWRLSDRAVQVIAHLLDKPPVRLRLLRPNDPGPAEARQWLKDAN